MKATSVKVSISNNFKGKKFEIGAIEANLDGYPAIQPALRRNGQSFVTEAHRGISCHGPASFCGGAAMEELQIFIRYVICIYNII